MSGPEHYRAAEDLAHDARLILERQTPNTGAEANAGASALAELAQVHATLALVAATVAARVVSPQQGWGGHDVTLAVADDWAVLL